MKKREAKKMLVETATNEKISDWYNAKLVNTEKLIFSKQEAFENITDVFVRSFKNYDDTIYFTVYDGNKTFEHFEVKTAMQVLDFTDSEKIEDQKIVAMHFQKIFRF